MKAAVVVVSMCAISVVASCSSAEGTEPDDEAASEVAACPTGNAAIQQQARARRVLRYILGGPKVGTWCTAVTDQASLVRKDYLEGRYGSLGTFDITDTWACGLRASFVRLSQSGLSASFVGPPVGPAPSGPYRTTLAKLNAAAKACWGNGIEHFMLSSTIMGPFLPGTAPEAEEIDPEPARLDADLLGASPGTAATAAAHGLNSSEAMTAYRFGSSTLSASGRSAWIGMPCVSATETAKAGQVLGKFVTYANPGVNTYLKCVVQ